MTSLGEAVDICDPIDPAACLLPWPNDFYTTPDPSPDTGRRLNLDALATPRNVAGVPIDPTDYNRNDGFSPGSLIVTRVPGLDNPEAFANTNPVGLTDLARYTDADAPVAVLKAATGARHPIWVELDRSEELTTDSDPPAPDDTNRAGVDPHGPDWSEHPDGKLAIGTFLGPLGWLPFVCGTAPCYLDGWTGPA